MPQYLCRVMTDDGRIIADRYTGESKNELISMFTNRGYRPISITEEVKGLGDTELGSKKLKKKSLILFCRQTATLLHAGIPIVKCFDIIGAQADDKVLKRAMEALSSDVQTGMPVSKSMEKQPAVFPEMLAKMVEVGEVTGELEIVMERMANQYESDSRIAKKVRGAMTYPLVLIVVALAACVFMLIAVVPQFVEIFDSLNTDLPGLTKMLLAVSEFITHKWYVLILVTPIIVLLLIKVFQMKQVVRWLDEKKLTFKLIRSPMQKILCAQMARTLHTMISSGVTIVQALEYTNNNIKNTYARGFMDKIIVGVQQGKGISVQMSKFEIFPKMLVSMINIGEQSGNLEDMLSKTADYYDEELDAAVSQLTSMMEPFMILLVGILIGGIVMALYAPMFGAISAMSTSL